ncbi:MAG: UDP-N-acetylmuramoyl-tripeptide--D-alanyl-D-alanine ligase [Proteobacteria bacterium]|nr:UDP-N-acetylmuramoyl-tripeptide--D-alanyl-D-alanine ligase [Pseudomonadota bacterium]
MTIAQALAATGGALIGPQRATTGLCTAVSTDSRNVPRGAAFVALRGEQVDGHSFWPQAAAAGAPLVLLERPPAAELLATAPCAVLLVPDTLRALGALALAWRLTVAPRVIGITGSVGKTTTKELTQQILALAGPTHYNRGNLNNQLGLPLTLLALPEATRYLVVEMGMSTRGEIAYLASLARPDLGLITALAPVHLEGLGTIEAIAAEKAALLDALGPEGCAIVPDDEPLLDPPLRRSLARQRLRFGSSPGADARLLATEPAGAAGQRLTLTLRGERLELMLPLVGRHNAQNASAAACIALALGIEHRHIIAGLSRPPELGHRSRVRRLGPLTLLDDCYNASPLAVRAALTALVELAQTQPAVAVLGEMRELGAQAEALHEEVGRAAAQLPLAGLVVVGAAARAIADGARAGGLAPQRIVETDDPAAAARRALELLPRAGWILVKASRGARLERVVETLLELAPATGRDAAADRPAPQR